jgi:hypothetical protein
MRLIPDTVIECVFDRPVLPFVDMTAMFWLLGSSLYHKAVVVGCAVYHVITALVAEVTLINTAS